MAADNLKLTVRALLSANADYSSPRVDFNLSPYALTPDEYKHMRVSCNASTEGNIDFASFSSITLMIIKNTHTGNVTARFDTANRTDVDIVIPTGGYFITPDVTVAGDLLLFTASGDGEAEVFLVGT